MTKDGTYVKCKYCGHKWKYTGKMKVYIMCSDCMKRQNKKEAIVRARSS